LQTVSLRRVLDFFGSSIVELEAQGGNAGGNTEELNEDYGVTYYTSNVETLKINYKQKRRLSGEPENPLDENGIETVLALLDEKVPPQPSEGEEHLGDIAVQKIVIEKIDDDLASIAAKATDWFDGNRNRFLLTGINDPVEERVGTLARAPLDEVLAKNRDLTTMQGFKNRVINFRYVIETARVYGNEELLYIAQWKGPEDNYPKFPTIVGEYIYEKILPPTYSEVNYYSPDELAVNLRLVHWKSR